MNEQDQTVLIWFCIYGALWIIGTLVIIYGGSKERKPQ